MRKRRFSRHKEINIDQNDVVVNLSSKDLKPDGIRILSKGLNFCPIPNKINEEQLSAGLDKFARSLQQEHFRLFETRQTQSVRFYLLPTIHKVNNPGRSIVSGNGHPTEKSPNSSISTFDFM